MTKIYMAPKITTLTMLIVFIAILSACSGSGGSGTEDYRPLTEYSDGGITGEEIGGNINYPDGYIPPVVTIISPTSGVVINPELSTVMVSGTIEQGQSKTVTLLINGDDVKISADNTFTAEIKLSDDSLPFAVIEASAIDENGYAGRDRIAVLRGASIASGTKTASAFGAEIGNDVLKLPQRFDTVIKDLLNDSIGKKVINTDYIRLEVVSPFKAQLALKLTGINIKKDNDVKVNRLTAQNPNESNKAKLFADMNIKGVEISADIKFLSIENLDLSGLADTRVVIELNSLAAGVMLKMGVKEATGLGIDVSDLDLNIKELQADIPSMIILTKLLDGLKISHSTYYMKLPLKGWLAGVVSEALNKIVNKSGLEMIAYIPPVSLDIDSMLPQKGKIELLDSVKGIRDLIIGAELEKFFGSENNIGIMAGLSAKSRIIKNNGIISIGTSITLDDALKLADGNDLNAAVSSEYINSMLAALNEVGFGLSLEIGKLLPDIGLPSDMKADVILGAPPFIDFKNGKIMLFVPNLLAGLYINSSKQIEVAIDLISEVEPQIYSRGGLPYMKLELKLNRFNLYYLADSMGIERAIDIERAVTRLMPQIITLINEWLEKNALVIDDVKSKDILEKLAEEDNELVLQICDDLPYYEMSLESICLQGGYLTLGINAR